MPDFPLIVVALTVCAYWGRVGAMVARARRKSRHLAGLVPEQPKERAMWLIWVPLVAAWMTLPWLGVARAAGSLAVPAFAQQMPYALLRWIAAGVAVWSLLQTLRCWRRMGKDWRMDVSQEKAALITDGLYARIRHPIYAFSVLLMLCTLLVLPTPAMAVLAAVHVVLMNVKARNEERHLLEVHGEPYAHYLRGTGRFIPRFGGPGS